MHDYSFNFLYQLNNIKKLRQKLYLTSHGMILYRNGTIAIDISTICVFEEKHSKIEFFDLWVAVSAIYDHKKC